MTLVTPPSGPDFDVTDYEALSYYRREPGYVVHDGVSAPLSPAPFVTAWAASTHYFVGQTVSAPDGTLARAVTSHISGSVFATDLAAGKWSQTLTSAAANATYQPAIVPTGLVGDGVADDSAAIYAAVVAAAAAPRGRVVLPKGTYKISTAQGSAPLTRSLLYFQGSAYDGVQITGEPGAVLTTAHATAGLIEFRDCTGPTVKNLKMVGAATGGVLGSNQRTDADISGAAVRFTNVIAGKIKDCDVSVFGYSSIYLTGGSSYCEVSGNYIHDGGVNGWSNGINEDTLAGTAGGGVVALQRGNKITGNNVKNCSGAGGIILDNAYVATGTIVSGNTVDQNRYFQGIRLANCQDITIDNNKVWDCVSDGIYYELVGGSADLYGVKIINNTVEGVASRTIGKGIVINVVNGGVGVRTLDISGNTVKDMGYDGVWIWSHDLGQIRDLTFDRNQIIHCDTATPGTHDGVYMLASNVSAVGNRINGRASAHRYGLNLDTACQNVAWVGAIAGSLTSDFHDTAVTATLFVDTINGTVAARGTAGALGTLTKAGSVSDADLNFAANGMFAFDSTNRRQYARIGGAWYSAPIGNEILGAARTGYYVVPQTTSLGTVTLANNTMRLAPISLAKTLTAVRIGIEVVTTPGNAGSLIRLGIYSDDGNYLPGALLLDAGTVAADTTGYKEITISQSLPTGRYFVAAAAQSAATTAPVIRGLGGICPGVIAVAAPVTANLAGYLDSQTVSGALPGTASPTTNVGGPLVHIKG